MLIKHICNLRLDESFVEPEYDSEDILVISGGISCCRWLVIDWIQEYLYLNDTVEVILVLDPIDYCNGNVDEVNRWYKNQWVRRLHVLQNTSVIINGVAFWGSTYWSYQPSLVEPFDWYGYKQKSHLCMRMFLKLHSTMSTVLITDCKPPKNATITLGSHSGGKQVYFTV